MKKNKIIYLDYSATTKPDKSIVKKFNKVCDFYYANANSKHLFGRKSKNLIDKSIQNIANYFNIKKEEIIFTSGASESNNMVIKGISENDSRKHIITSKLEHQSILGPISYMQKKGYKIDFVNLNEDGIIDINHLKSLLNKDTLLVTIAAIDSEIGTKQPIEKIGKLLKEYNNIYFHSDITQCVGKDQIDLTNVDMASFSGHKIYTFKGIGGLIKKEYIKLNPLIHGGMSSSAFRSGTPQTELIFSLSEAFNLFKYNIESNYIEVYLLNSYLKKELSKIKNVKINSSNKSIPHILNFSIINKNANETQKYLEKHNIYVSTKTACASDTNLSKSVLELTKDETRAKTSIRISISYKTNKQEINKLIKTIKKYLKEN